LARNDNHSIGIELIMIIGGLYSVQKSRHFTDNLTLSFTFIHNF